MSFFSAMGALCQRIKRNSRNTWKEQTEDMPEKTNPQQEAWWAQGDTPVRTGSRVISLVDGRSAFFTLCCHLLKAHAYIYLANWGMTANLPLVRAQDQRAGPDGSSEQDALLATLRAEGLSQEAVNFWVTTQLTLQNILGDAVRRGVEVKVLLWNSLPLPSYSHYRPKETRMLLQQVGVTCLLDNSARGILHHPAESLHQKLSVIDGTVAFVGGLDPMIETKADFDRWDTRTHAFSTPLRQTVKGTTPHPWHDVHTRIEGLAAADVEYNFRQRWNSVVRRHLFTKPPAVSEHPLPAPVKSESVVQVARTIPRWTYHFEPKAVQGIAQIYTNALRQVQSFLYLENQYLWVRAYTGIDIPFIGRDNPQMEQIVGELIAALQRGVTVGLTLPDHPAPGRAFTDSVIERIRREAGQAVAEGRFQAFCLGTSHTVDGQEHYRPVYVHAKVAVVDDRWATVGSANLNNRGMRDDTEINVAMYDPTLAHSLRLRLWAEHMGLIADDEMFALERYLEEQPQFLRKPRELERRWKQLQKELGDPLTGLVKMEECARENLRRYKAHQPLVGHLLPYLLADEAHQQGLNFREAHGWLEEEEGVSS
jgi:phosphatidylserine/phosphatidylglycerophosphate/cardiolipin synthase-like enzyme